MADTEPGARRDGEVSKRSQTKRVVAAVVGLAVLVYLILFVAKNGQSAEVDWVFGSTTGPLVFVIFASALIGFLLGAVGLLLWQGRRRRRRRE